MRGSRGVWVVGGVLSLAACGGERGGTSSEAVVQESSAQTAAPGQTASPAYAFFEATRAGSAYRVTAVNGAPFACGWLKAARSCFVSSINLSALDLTPSAVTGLLAGVGEDPEAPVLLFAGTVTGNALVVQEVWRAPAAARLSGTLLHVSHSPQHALVVDQWTPQWVGTLDFSRAPGVEDCEAGDDGGTQCTVSQVPVQTDVVTEAGVLLEGWPERGGSFAVQQYFLKITIGAYQDQDGFGYCQADQTVCPNGACDTDGLCTKGHGGHGMDDQQAYIRSTNPTFDAWLVATGQLLPTDTP
jgi:hypothetical protein